MLIEKPQLCSELYHLPDNPEIESWGHLSLTRFPCSLHVFPTLGLDSSPWNFLHLILPIPQDQGHMSTSAQRLP